MPNFTPSIIQVESRDAYFTHLFNRNHAMDLDACFRAICPSQLFRLTGIWAGVFSTQLANSRYSCMRRSCLKIWRPEPDVAIMSKIQLCVHTIIMYAHNKLIMYAHNKLIMYVHNKFITHAHNELIMYAHNKLIMYAHKKFYQRLCNISLACTNCESTSPFCLCAGDHGASKAQ